MEPEIDICKEFENLSCRRLGSAKATIGLAGVVDDEAAGMRFQEVEPPSRP